MDNGIKHKLQLLKPYTTVYQGSNICRITISKYREQNTCQKGSKNIEVILMQHKKKSFNMQWQCIQALQRCSLSALSPIQNIKSASLKRERGEGRGVSGGYAFHAVPVA